MVEDIDLFLDNLPTTSLKLLVAVGCGLLLGLERERRDKPAGLRTIVLITVGSALFMIVSDLIPRIAEGSASVLSIDPGRIAAGVVSGIGFLGAGTIIQARGSVQGLTTAAVIWVASGIGLAAGAGFPLTAIAFALVTLVVLTLLDPIRARFARSGQAHELSFLAPNDSLCLRQIEQTFAQFGVTAEKLTFEPAGDDDVRVRAAYSTSQNANGQLLFLLSKIPDVHGTPRFE